MGRETKSCLERWPRTPPHGFPLSHQGRDELGEAGFSCQGSISLGVSRCDWLCSLATNTHPHPCGSCLICLMIYMAGS